MYCICQSGFCVVLCVVGLFGQVQFPLSTIELGGGSKNMEQFCRNKLKFHVKIRSNRPIVDPRTVRFLFISVIVEQKKETFP